MLTLKRVNKLMYVFCAEINSFVLYSDKMIEGLRPQTSLIEYASYNHCNIIAIDENLEEYFNLFTFQKLDISKIVILIEFIQKNNYLEKFKKTYKIIAPKNTFLQKLIVSTIYVK